MPENKTEKLEIETSKGILIVYPSTDPNNPGVYIDLKQPDSDIALNIACIECQEDSDTPKLVTHVWGSALNEDATHDITHTNTDEYFAGAETR